MTDLSYQFKRNMAKAFVNIATSADGDFLQDYPYSKDYLLAKKLVFYQPITGYRVAIDPILLAASMPKLKGSKLKSKASQILDMGAGAGAISLCALFHEPKAKLTLIEKQAQLCHFAAYNMAVNDYANRAHIIQADIGCADLLEEIGHNQFDRILMNPPFFDEREAEPSPTPLKAASHIMAKHDLVLWLDFAYKMVKNRGVISIIIPPLRLHEALGCFIMRRASMDIIPIQSFKNRAAKRIIMHIKKDVKPAMMIQPALILHDDRARLPMGSPNRHRFTPWVESLLQGNARHEW